MNSCTLDIFCSGFRKKHLILIPHRSPFHSSLLQPHLGQSPTSPLIYTDKSLFGKLASFAVKGTVIYIITQHTCSLSEGFPHYSILSTSTQTHLMCTRSVQKVSSHGIWKIETLTEEDTRYKNHWTTTRTKHLSLLQAGTLGPHTVLPIAVICPVIFSWISLRVWNLFHFKRFQFWENP